MTDGGNSEPTCVNDIRKALDDPNLDAVTVATCNHWHSLITIWACQAGKDVYVEKPISHNVFEGRKCVEAAAKYGRVVQHGTQQRSSHERAKEIAAVQSGKYGKLLVSKGYCCKPRWRIGTKPVEAPPAELDFNLWLGPAPEQPYHGNLVHYNWHWFWDTGNGDIGNQGVHEMDVARWAIKDATLAQERVEPGRPFRLRGSGSDAEHADGRVRLWRCAAGVRGPRPGGRKDPACPTRLERVLHNRGRDSRRRSSIRAARARASRSPTSRRTSRPAAAFGSFIHAVRSRKPEDNNANAEVAHLSAGLCHLANISYRLGEPTSYNKASKSLGDNKQVVESFDNLRDNLLAINLELDETTYHLGRT